MRNGDRTEPARTVRRAAAGLIMLAVAGCAAAETPMPFVDSPGERPAATPAPAAARAGHAAAPAAKLAYPTFAAPKVGDDRPVLDPAAQARMEADLQRLARERDQQAHQPVEQPQ